MVLWPESQATQSPRAPALIPQRLAYCSRKKAALPEALLPGRPAGVAGGATAACNKPAARRKLTARVTMSAAGHCTVAHMHDMYNAMAL